MVTVSSGLPPGSARKGAPCAKISHSAFLNNAFPLPQRMRHARWNERFMSEFLSLYITVPSRDVAETIGLNLFAHKAVLALHFEHIRQPLPMAGRICAYWKTKEDFAHGIPQSLLGIMKEYVAAHRVLRATRYPVSLCRAINRQPISEFVPDSPLEGAGFDPSVPATASRGV
jgi:hypothetical protein